MNRATLFILGIIVGVICLIIAILYLIHGSPLANHPKRGYVFIVIAIIAFIFAALNRPVGSRV